MLRKLCKVSRPEYRCSDMRVPFYLPPVRLRSTLLDLDAYRGQRYLNMNIFIAIRDV